MRFSLAALPLIALAGPAAAQAPYRAVGAESVWTLTIDARTMRLDQPGERPVIVPRPVPQTGANGERYVTRAIIVDTTRARCGVETNNRTYRDMVLVQIGQRRLRGCGGGAADGDRPAVLARTQPSPTVTKTSPVPSNNVAHPASINSPPLVITKNSPHPEIIKTGQRSALANTQWTVWQFKGRAIKAPRPLMVIFSGDLVEGKLCNLFRGNYAMNGEQLRVGAITARRTTCQGPAMTAETALFGMLRQPVHATVSRWGTLVLTSGRDTVTLRPFRR